ncbi:succinylglutamate desuccinylase/aspartoacylase family protein [Maioricimonas rarisocia]|nr:succinylglutamate desuccinylase/aspartoacylase family protein [Maioricimonas rarisocia]
MTDPGGLRTITIEGNSSGPHLLITAGVHGDEFTSIAAVRTLAQTVTSSELTGRLTLVPIANRAAVLRGERTAEDGLDLARVCPGIPEGSITERTAAALSALIRSADAYIDLHTGSSTMSVMPLVGYTLHRDDTVLNRQRQMALNFNLPAVWGTSPDLEGRTLSVARDAGIPAIYAEFLGAGVLSDQGVEAYVDGCRNVMGLLGMVDREQPECRIGYVFEDERPGSGHMQVQNPSPATGFFRAVVELGDRVRPGDRIGRVVNIDDDTVTDIVCEVEGIVIVIWTFPVIHEGDSAFVILEIPENPTPPEED